MTDAPQHPDTGKRPGYEARDANVRAIAISGGVLAAVVVFSFVYVRWLFHHYEAQLDESRPGLPALMDASPVPPKPRLRVNAVRELADWRAQEDVLLTSYAWIPQAQGVARIPVARAMEIIAEHGLPTWAPPPEAATNAVAGATNAAVVVVATPAAAAVPRVWRDTQGGAMSGVAMRTLSVLSCGRDGARPSRTQQTPISRFGGTASVPSALKTLCLTCALLACGLGTAPARAADTATPMAQTNLLSQARLEQRLDAQIPLNLGFLDEAGQPVRLGDYFGQRPVVLVMAYYECPMLCTLVLNGLVKALNVVDLQMGRDYNVVTVSFDPRETPPLAAAKKKSYVAEYRRGGAAEGWHFLTGQPDAIRQLTEAVGFHYAYDEVAKQFAHAAGCMVATPEGRLSKYFYGVEFSGRDLRLGLVDAAQHRIGTRVDQLLLWCYHYDPVTGKYGLAVMRLMRVGAALTVAGLALFLYWALRREPRPVQPGVAP